MAGRGGCFKRQSPLANQAALVEAASARLGSAEPRVVPCAAQTSEQYRYVAAARACHHHRRCRRSARTTFQTAPAPARSAAGISSFSSRRLSHPLHLLSTWVAGKEETIQVFQLFNSSSLAPGCRVWAPFAEPPSAAAPWVLASGLRPPEARCWGSCGGGLGAAGSGGASPGTQQRH